jgi:hypothetical protein
MVFTVWFDSDMKVVRTATGRDPDDPELSKGSK